MPFDQKNRRSETKSVTKNFEDREDQSLTVNYYRNSFLAREQARFEDQVMRLAKDMAGHSEEMVDVLSGYLEKAVASWDLMNDGKVVELKKEAIGDNVLPDVLLFVFQMISEDKSGGKGSPAVSPPA